MKKEILFFAGFLLFFVILIIFAGFVSAVWTDNEDGTKVSTSQQVGIGTNAPSSPLYILHDKSNNGLTIDRNSISTRKSQIMFSQQGTTRWAIGVDASQNNTQNFFIWDQDSKLNRFFIDSSGNVGIGTTNPTAKLTVSGGRIQLDNNQQLTALDSSGIPRNLLTLLSTNNTKLNAAANQNILFMINNIEKMRLASNGNVGIGTESPTAKLEVNGEIKATDFLYTSDERLKENIIPLKNSLEKIQQLQGVSFDWKENHENNIGFIAQDVEKIFPELVVTGGNGFKSVKYGNLVAVLIEALKEQQKEIESQNSRISELEKEIERLKN